MRERAGWLIVAVSMFDGFDLALIALPEARLRVRCGGSGPPLLLLAEAAPEEPAAVLATFFSRK